jgi:hypothetical protein
MRCNHRSPIPSVYVLLLVVSIQTLGPRAVAQKYLFGRADFGTGNNPSSVAIGDFNRDGKQDLVVTNFADNTVSVFLGKLGATFATKVDYQTGNGPVAVTVGDFNGDGKLDLAVANLNDNTISILLGNGNGTFRNRVDYATAFGPFYVVAADLNKDRKLDLVVSTQSLAISVLLGNGNGSFGPHVDYADANGGGAGPAGTAAVGDFNRDGRLDLAIAVPDDNAVSVLLGNGDGTFQTFVEYATPANPTAVAIGDFNRDGKLDLAVATAGVVGTASLLMGNGDGTFQTHVDYQVGPTPSFIAAVDLNGDGKLDLAVDNQNCVNFPCGFGSISILLGRGDGTFQPHLDYGTGSSPSFAISDFNGDGRLDLAIAHENCVAFSPCGPGTVSILLGNGNGTFPGEVAYAVGTAPASVAVADFNRDGRLDLAVANSAAGTVSVLLGKGKGSFRNHVDYSVGQNVGAITVGDFNDDAKMDFAVTTAVGVSVFLGKGDGTFQTPTSYATGPGPGFIVAADFNGDGKLDLAVTNVNGGFGTTVSVLLGNGDGTFQPHNDFPAGTFVFNLAVGDFNRDGKLDLAVTNNTNVGTVSILLGTGNGSFEAPVTSSTAQFPQSLAVSDFNRDGIPDLAVASVFNPGALSVLLGKGDGTFEPPVTYGTGSNPQSVTAADLNHDGKIDLAVTNQNDNTVSVFLGNGDGTFQPHVDFATGNQPLSAAAGDFSGDGGLDLATANVGDNTVSVLLNTAVVAISPSSVNFGNQLVGTKSSPLTVRLKNPSSVPLEISAIQIAGVDLTDFGETNNCRHTLAVGSSCAINVTFTPKAKGTRIGVLEIIDTAQSPQRIRLTGHGQ